MIHGCAPISNNNRYDHSHRHAIHSMRIIFHHDRTMACYDSPFSNVSVNLGLAQVGVYSK